MESPSYHVPQRLHADRRQPVIVHAATLDWTPSPSAGVERRFLEREGGEIARATSIVRYAPNSRFPEHVHELGEEYLVLEGVFSDHDGDFGPGTYVRNPPGSRHAPFTREGCVIFVKLRQMSTRDRGLPTTITRGEAPVPVATPGLTRIPLYSVDDREQVCLEQLDPGTRWSPRIAQGGEEILVLDGALDYGDTACGAWTWLRIPHGREQPIASRKGCRYWVKRGHLPS
jgi:anti-sigma factor ChrR (cupin superfamily)